MNNIQEKTKIQISFSVKANQNQIWPFFIFYRCIAEEILQDSVNYRKNQLKDVNIFLQ